MKRNIAINKLTFLILASSLVGTFIYNTAYGQMPEGKKPMFKLFTYKYRNWKLRRGDSILTYDNTNAVLQALEIYKIQDKEKVFLRLVKKDSSLIEGELVTLLTNGTIYGPEDMDLGPAEPGSDGNKIDMVKKGYYIAQNGITYKEGDFVEFGFGSSPNGSYQYLMQGGFISVASFDANKGANQFDMAKGFNGIKLPIIKIKSVRYMGQTKVYFVVKMPIGRANLWIDDAIAKCEVVPCQSQKPVLQQLSSADEILKFKKLMDEGVITKEEFEAKKKQLLMK